MAGDGHGDRLVSGRPVHFRASGAPAGWGCRRGSPDWRGRMNHHWLDDLVRALATTSSRREAIKVLGAGATTGLLAMLGAEEVGGKGKKKKEKKCRTDADCGDCGFCGDSGTCQELIAACTDPCTRCNKNTWKCVKIKPGG